jgi:hypothetical protein
MAAVISTIVMLLTVLNWFASIGAGIWLLVLGDWQFVLDGFLIMIGAWFFLGFAVMPGALLFGAPGAYLIGKGHPFFGMPLVMLGIVCSRD